MNLKLLRKLEDRLLRLRPQPIVLSSNPAAGSPLPHKWRVEKISDNSWPAVLTHVGTSLSVKLCREHIHCYAEPDVLWLNCQIAITDGQVTVEPLSGHIGRLGRNAPFEIDLPLAGPNNHDWTPVHGSGGPAGHRIFVFNWLIRTRCWLQPGHVESDKNGKWVHPGCNLRSPQERFVFAAAVHHDDVDRFVAAFDSDTINVAVLERRLLAAKVRYRLTDPRRIRRSS